MKPGVPEIVFDGNYIKVMKELSEDGKQVFEKAKFRDGVSVIILVRSGMYRFIQEYDKVRKQERIKLVSAYLHDHEDSLECAKRELKEETGLTAEKWELLHCYEAKGTIQKKQFFWIASNLTEGEANPDAEEDIHGTVDLTWPEVEKRALRGDFGQSESAYAIMKCMPPR